MAIVVFIVGLVVFLALLVHVSLRSGVPIPELFGNMGYNLAWYVPLCLLVLAYVVPENFRYAFQSVQVCLKRFTWAVLLSPSAGLFAGSAVSSVLIPLEMLLLIPGCFDKADQDIYRRRFLWTVGTVVAIPLLSFLFVVLMWGSLPLEVDSQGVGRLRLFPFIPWPERPFW